jgi:hypothetical protein
MSHVIQMVAGVPLWQDQYERKKENNDNDNDNNNNQ